MDRSRQKWKEMEILDFSFQLDTWVVAAGLLRGPTANVRVNAQSRGNILGQRVPVRQSASEVGLDSANTGARHVGSHNTLRVADDAEGLKLCE